MVRQVDQAPDSRPALQLILIVVSWAIMALVFEFRYRPRSVRAVGEPDKFSAVSAIDSLKSVLGPEVPRPAGSLANQRVRAALVARLTHLGFEVDQQQETVEVRGSKWIEFNGREVTLNNIVARKRGRTGDAPAILLACHYDSVPAGPGICDDGFGVAVCLEIIELLEHRSLRRDLIVLFSDAEELGVLGAREFVSKHPWRADADVGINVEARGAAGSALMFETGANSAFSIAQFARIQPRKFTSSLFYEVYRQLPNDTDFTQFKRAGLQGFNLAFIGDARVYHTAQDDLEHANLATLQHLGDTAWELLLGLDSAETPAAVDRVVYTDVLGAFLIWWPESWSLPLAAIVLGVILFAPAFRALPTTWRGCVPVRTLAFAVGSLLMAAIGVGVLYSLLRWSGTLAIPWPNRPVWGELSFLSASVATIVGWSWLWPGRVDSAAMAQAVWLLWSLLGLATAILVPGASYLFLLPMAVAALVSATSCFFPNWPWIWSAMPAVVAGFFWMPLERLFYDAVGFTMPVALVVRFSLIASLLLPSIAGLGVRQKGHLGAIVCGLLVVSYGIFIISAG